MASASTRDRISYKVTREPENGGKIAGKRRALGETFEASEADMHFVELEGLVEKVAPVPPAKAPRGTKADPPEA